MDILQRVETAFEEMTVDPAISGAAMTALTQWISTPMYAPYIPYMESLVSRQQFGLLLDSFWQMMPFGTGGRRGPVGAGPNRINPITFGLSVQGHCRYLREVLGLSGDISVVVAWDVRKFHDLRGVYPDVTGVLTGLTSLDLARVAATTYAANGVRTIVAPSLIEASTEIDAGPQYISTPELSFLIRKYGASGGLNVSASHNHPDDNGGKFYNRHGGQEIPPDDEALLRVVESVTEMSSMSLSDAIARGWIETVSPQAHQEYIALNIGLSATPSRSARIGFTPLCGTGMTNVHEALTTLGYEVIPVQAQSEPDGTFASVRYRIGNPEVPESMDMLEETCRQHACDIGLSTDPDADRLGAIVPDATGAWRFINGNELGALLLQSILSSRLRTDQLPKRGIFVNTLVTSRLQRTIAAAYGLQVIGDLMVGCKYIGDVIRSLEAEGRFPGGGMSTDDRDSVTGTLADYVFGCEESHGFLVSVEVRDKDACGAAVQLAGLCSELKDQGRTIPDLLRDVYRVYGYCRNTQRSLVMEGITGMNRIRRIQAVLREHPPRTLAGRNVIRFVDYQVVGDPLQSETDASSRNVLRFDLDGDENGVIQVVIRPSGTEPKTKIYVEVPSKRRIGGTLDGVSADSLQTVSDAQLDDIMRETDDLASTIAAEVVKFCLGPAVLGDVYGEVDDEVLRISDLMTVDNKLTFCRDILPALIQRVKSGEPVEAWLNSAMAPLGEGAHRMVRHAAAAWLDRLSVAATDAEKQSVLAFLG